MIQDEIAIIDQKRKAWGNMGVIIHKQEMGLQAKAQDALLKLSLPVNIQQVPEHEKLLKELKQIQQAIEADRKKITGKFDDLSKRLALPEKSLTDPINNLQMEIIKLKKEHEESKKKDLQKLDEIKAVKEKIITYLSETKARHLSLINSTVADLYGFALGAGNIQPAALPDYIESCKSRLSIFDFQAKKISIAAIHAEQSEIDAVVAESYKPVQPADYVQMFHDLLIHKFSDYEVAFNNKAEALQQSEHDKEKAAIAINDQKDNAIVAAKLDTLSSTVMIDEPVKPLKESFEIDMPETLETAVAIMKAFISNIQLCNSKLRVNKWFSFTTLQMGISLGKVKSDDNNFQPAGITFKKVEKI